MRAFWRGRDRPRRAGGAQARMRVPVIAAADAVGAGDPLLQHRRVPPLPAGEARQPALPLLGVAHRRQFFAQFVQFAPGTVAAAPQLLAHLFGNVPETALARDIRPLRGDGMQQCRMSVGDDQPRRRQRGDKLAPCFAAFRGGESEGDDLAFARRDKDDFGCSAAQPEAVQQQAFHRCRRRRGGDVVQKNAKAPIQSAARNAQVGGNIAQAGFAVQPAPKPFAPLPVPGGGVFARRADATLRTPPALFPGARFAVPMHCPLASRTAFFWSFSCPFLKRVKNCRRKRPSTPYPA